MSVLNSSRPIIQEDLKGMLALVPDAPDATARDWAAFFQALAAFAANILPLILPLFAEKETK